MRRLVGTAGWFCFACGVLLAQVSTTTTLTSVSPSNPVFGQAVTLNAQVTPMAAPGNVSFVDGGMLVGVGALNASGVAQLTTITLSAGSHSLRAVYGGATGYAASHSASQAYTVTAAGGTGFIAAVTYNMQYLPQSVGVADFNGDGKADLVLTNPLTYNVSVLLGKGDGTFQAAVNYPVTPPGRSSSLQPWNVAIGDFNVDGKADLAVTDYYGISVLLGNGDGSFGAAVEYGAAAVGTAPAAAIAVGDFNGDGKPDLVTTGNGDGTVCVLMGNGDGTFQNPVFYAAGTDPGSVSVGDFNSDGKSDLVVSSWDSSSKLTFLTGNGDGTFQAAGSLVMSGNAPLTALGDFNGDGKLDVAVADRFGSVLLGKGDGTFQSPKYYYPVTSANSISAGDFNGDGILDLVETSVWDDAVNVFLGNGDGTFQSPMRYCIGGTSQSVIAGDFNGDGRADIADTAGVLLAVQSTQPAAFSISLTHAGEFVQGQRGVYNIVVANAASSGPSTSGTVTVTDTLPTGMTLYSVSAPGWNCTGLTCSRSDPLNSGASWPAIVVTVNVSATAASPLVNSASMTGMASDTATDSTVIQMAAQSLNCTAMVPAPPLARLEGMTELIGDIVITCTGGTQPAANTGNPLPTGNFSIYLSTNTTSRLVSGTSEALLLIDEPGAPINLPGAQFPQTICPTPSVGAGSGGCRVYAQSFSGTTLMSSSPCVAGGPCTANNPPASPAPPYNVFPGTAGGNGVSFTGVPILPPAPGSVRVYRITNIRLNASALSAGTVYASISVAALSLTGPTQTVAFIQPTLTTSMRDPANSGPLPGAGAAADACSVASSPSPVGMLQFSEGFSTTFKTRVAPTSIYNGQSGSPAQNVPGTLHNSESGFVMSALSSAGVTAGLSDYGTRLRAVFSGIPAGMRIFVSTTNLPNTSSATPSAPAGDSTASYAVLVTGETTPDGDGAVPAQSATTTVNGGATRLTELSVVNGSATAVWEVVNTNPAANEILNFGVWQQVNSVSAGGTAKVTLSYSPAPPAFSASSGAQPSATLTVPRFLTSSSTLNLLTTSCSAAATITSPAPNSILPSSAVTFRWTAGIGVTDYRLSIGRTQGSLELYDQDQGVNLSAAVNGFPVDGGLVWVRLSSTVGGALVFNDYAYSTTQALRFVAVAPCRVADTRKAAGPFGGPQIAGGVSRDFTIPNSTCGIPATAQAYALNVAAVPAGPLGYLTVWPTGQPQPVASTLNSLDGRTKSNAAIIPAGTAGAISVFASNATDVVLDINGYFVPATDPSALAFYPLAPCRIADTRKPTAPLGGPSIAGQQTRTFPILSSTCNIPASAQAYSLNFAAVPPGPLGYITVWPTGLTQPVVSTLNAITGTVTANAAIVPAGTNGSIDVFASNATNLVIDVNGYFAPAGAGGLSLYNVTPCRVLDTRKPSGTQPFSGELDASISNTLCGIPAASQAFVLGATVVPPGPLGYLTLWPQGQLQPVVATLNAVDGAVTSNLAIVPTNNGSISAFLSNPAYLVLDIFGYFAQ